MKVIIFIKNIRQTHQRLSKSGYGHLASDPDNIICDYDLKAIATVLSEQNSKMITETIAVAIGADEVDPALEYCLALGVNKAVKLHANNSDCCLLDQAKMLHSYVQGFSEYVVVFGYNSALNEINSVAPMLASLLECSQLNMALGLKFGSNNCMVQYRKGADILETTLAAPVVITTNSSGAHSAAATLYDLMRVNAGQITIIDMTDNESANAVQHRYYKKDQPEKSCKILGDMPSLHGLLKTVAKL
jgi:electron transfer flavoprotein alpha/beta subunit